MIRIRTGQLRDATAELSVHKEQTAELKERLLQTERDVSRQSYTEETVCRLKGLLERLEEIRADCDAICNGLKELIGLAVGTEKRITQVYTQERPIPRIPETGISQIMIHDRLEDIAKIEL